MPELVDDQQSLREPSASRPTGGSAIWSKITLLPHLLPGFAHDEISTDLRFLDRTCRLPVVLAADGEPVLLPDRLALLAAAAAEAGIALTIGDIDPLSADRAAIGALRSALDQAAEQPVLGQVGLTAFLGRGPSRRSDAGRIQSLLDDLGLSALILHLDLAEFTLASDARPDASNVLAAVYELIDQIRLPVLARATSGLPRAMARQLIELGVAGIIVGGGEVFAVEAMRRGGPADQPIAWGIPALAAIRMLRGIGMPIVSEALVARGDDAAKALALGADFVMLRARADSQQTLGQELARFASELRSVMFLTGARKLTNLKHVPFVATGETREWLEAAEVLWKADTGYD